MQANAPARHEKPKGLPPVSTPCLVLDASKGLEGKRGARMYQYARPPRASGGQDARANATRLKNRSTCALRLRSSLVLVLRLGPALYGRFFSLVLSPSIVVGFIYRSPTRNHRLSVSLSAQTCLNSSPTPQCSVYHAPAPVWPSGSAGTK